MKTKGNINFGKVKTDEGLEGLSEAMESLDDFMSDLLELEKGAKGAEADAFAYLARKASELLSEGYAAAGERIAARSILKDARWLRNNWNK
jgi:hypothetical protein